MTGWLRRVVQAVRQAGRRVWGGVLLGAGLVTATAYLARVHLAAAAAQVFGWCRGLVEEAGAALCALLLALTVCGL